MDRVNRSSDSFIYRPEARPELIYRVRGVDI
jgi:hypothetical protein